MLKSSLWQISERRKLVSSIESSIINPEDNEASFEERDSSFTSLDIASTDGSDTHKEYNRDVSPSSVVQPNVDELMEKPGSAIGTDFGEVVNEPKTDLPLKNYLEVDSPQKQESGSGRVWSSELPTFLSDSPAKSSLKYEKHEDLKEPSLDGHENVPTIEDVKPPPLAGANVMNIILVAAECAPWSKTGVYLFIYLLEVL